MNKRICKLRLTIDNGVRREYRVTPCVGAELGTSFVLGFRLDRVADATPGVSGALPAYRVRVALDGVVNCDCPQWLKIDSGQRCGAEAPNGLFCKHAQALHAAGLLPVALLQLLQARTKLLDAAEARISGMVRDRLRAEFDEANRRRRSA